MLEMIKKSLLASLGAAVVTREKVEQATKRWVEEGRISREEAEKLAQELVESGQHQWEEIQRRLTDTVRKGFDSFDIGSKREFQELQERVAALESRVARLEEKESAEGA